MAVIFAGGLVAWAVRLPPLIGFLIAGFALNAMGAPYNSALEVAADIGVTLMLFAIGLRLDLKALTDKAVWLTAGAHIILITALGAVFIMGVGALGAFGPSESEIASKIAFVLSFRSRSSSLKFVKTVVMNKHCTEIFVLAS